MRVHDLDKVTSKRNNINILSHAWLESSSANIIYTILNSGKSNSRVNGVMKPYKNLCKNSPSHQI